MNAHSPALSARRTSVPVNWLGTAGFFSICALTMLNLNFFTRLFLQTEQVLSVFYLASCLLILFALKFPIFKSIGSVGVFWLFAISVYLIVSTRFGIGIDRAYFTSPASNLYRVMTAQLITVAAAVGARHLLFAGKLQLALRILFGFTVLAGSTIFLSKLFPVLAPLQSQTQGRVGGVFTDSNAAGQALCYSAAFGFACLVREKSLLARCLIFIGLASLVPSLLLTNSRSAIIFMGLLVVAQIVASPLFKQKGTMIAVLVLAIGIPVGIVARINQQASYVNASEAANVEGQKDRLASFGRILRGEMTSNDTGQRFVVGAVGLRYFFSSPVVGVGFHKLTLMPEVNLGCHNTFILVMGESGIFGGIVFVAAVVFLGLASWNCRMPDIRCLGLSFALSYACSCMVAHSLLTSRISNVIMGICFGLLSGAISLGQAEVRRKRAEMRMGFPNIAPPRAKATF